MAASATNPPDLVGSRLYAVAHALTGALSPDDVARAVYERALADLGAATAGFWLLDGGVLRFAGQAGKEDGPAQVGDIPLDSDLPGAAVARTGLAVAFGSVEERDLRWPALRGVAHVAQAVAVLPMTVQNRTLGCLHVGYADPLPVGDMEMDLLQALADLCAAALHRAQLFERERLQREQLEFFAEATRVLTRSLEPSEVVQALVDIAVPRLAEWCTVLIAREGDLVPAAFRLVGENPEERRAVAGEVLAIDGEFHTSRCYRDNQVQVIDPLPPTLQPVAAQTASVIARVGVRSALLVPIPWAGSPIGVLSLGFTRPGQAGERRTQEMADGLALRAGMALNNAERFNAERTVARTLTEALLPRAMPSIPGYGTAAQYLPMAGDVAGDWYDLVDLGDKVLVGIGDAAGHGIPAASLMAELRNAARGLAAAGQGPGEILHTLRKLAEASGDESFSTAIYALLDPASHELIWASAGHPPPILLRGSDLSVLSEEQSGVSGPPIAAGMGRDRSENRRILERGDTLVLYTDGVIERRDSSLDEGIERLAQTLVSLSGEPPAVIVAKLTQAMCVDATDDCCVLVIQRRE